MISSSEVYLLVVDRRMQIVTRAFGPYPSAEDVFRAYRNVDFQKVWPTDKYEMFVSFDITKSTLLDTSNPKFDFYSTAAKGAVRSCLGCGALVFDAYRCFGCEHLLENSDPIRRLEMFLHDVVESKVKTINELHQEIAKYKEPQKQMGTLMTMLGTALRQVEQINVDLDAVEMKVNKPFQETVPVPAETPFGDAEEPKAVPKASSDLLRAAQYLIENARLHNNHTFGEADGDMVVSGDVYTALEQAVIREEQMGVEK